VLEREVRAFDSKRSTARDDAPNADKQNFFEGDRGDRVAFVPWLSSRTKAAGLRVGPTRPCAPSRRRRAAFQFRLATQLGNRGDIEVLLDPVFAGLEQTCVG
jgi:hypothetical protein